MSIQESFNSAKMMETLFLHQLAVHAEQLLPPGVFYPEIQAQRLMQMPNDLLIRLRAYVLCEKAGPVQRTNHIHDAVNFPWWIPKWLRRRWTKEVEVRLEVQPVFIYPSSSIKVPALGKPVRIAVHPSAIID